MIDLENLGKKSSPKLSIHLKHVILLVCATILVIYVVSTKLNIDYRVGYQLGRNLFGNYNYSANNDLDLNESTAKVVVNCNPLKSKSDMYFIKIDGVEYPKSVSLFLNKSIDFQCLNQSTNVKYILAWTGFFGEFTPFTNALKSKHCPVTNCIVTSDRTKLNVSDLVLVHMVNLKFYCEILRLGFI